MALLEVKNIYKSFGGVKAIQDFSLAADAGQIHGIIGPNGAGKTTIFNVISGVYPADQGSVTLNGQDITKIEQYKITRLGMGRTFQNIRLFKGLTVEENVMCAFDPQSRYSILGGLVPTPRRRAEEKRGRELCRKYLEIVGMADFLNERPENLSYGMQRRIEIARALMCEPKVLLLDEPAAGLNPTEVSELTELIQRISKEIGFGILLIEHRLELVMSISDIIHVQNFGKTIAVGTPAEVQHNPEVIEAYLAGADRLHHRRERRRKEYAAAHHFRPCEAVERQGGVFGRTAAEKTEQNRGKRDCACAGGPQDFFRPDHPG